MCRLYGLVLSRKRSNNSEGADQSMPCHIMKLWKSRLLALN